MKPSSCGVSKGTWLKSTGLHHVAVQLRSQATKILGGLGSRAPCSRASLHRCSYPFPRPGAIPPHAISHARGAGTSRRWGQTGGEAMPAWRVAILFPFFCLLGSSAVSKAPVYAAGEGGKTGLGRGGRAATTSSKVGARKSRILCVHVFVYVDRLSPLILASSKGVRQLPASPKWGLGSPKCLGPESRNATSKLITNSSFLGRAWAFGSGWLMSLLRAAGAKPSRETSPSKRSLVPPGWGGGRFMDVSSPSRTLTSSGSGVSPGLAHCQAPQIHFWCKTELRKDLGSGTPPK